MIKDPTGPHKLKFNKRSPAPQKRIRLFTTFKQVCGLLWNCPGYQVQLATEKGVEFLARAEPHPASDGRSIITLPWKARISESTWGWNKMADLRTYIKTYSMALDNWTMRSLKPHYAYKTTKVGTKLRRNSAATQAIERAFERDLITALSWYLAGNKNLANREHWPALVDVAVEAIKNANADKWDKPVKMPKGFKKKHLPAGTIIETLRLYGWLENKGGYDFD